MQTGRVSGYHKCHREIKLLLRSLQAQEAATAAVARIYRNIGFSGLWNGLPVRIVMLGTLTGFQWLM